MPKARKKHTCDLCGLTINPGERYHYFSGKYNGDFITTKTCMICNKIVNTYCDWAGENEWSEEEVEDWLWEQYCHDCEHSEWENDDCECETKSKASCPIIHEKFKE
jgi:hypothetical protein